MTYEKEFKVTADQVRREVNRIKKEKRQYDDYGKPWNPKKN